MVMLVTLEQAKKHLRVVHDSDDDDIVLKIEGASGAILNYLKDSADTFIDVDTGEIILTEDSPPASTVPKVVMQATLLLLGDFFKNREPTSDDPVIGVEFGFGHLPRAVIALLYHYRLPTLK